jgi:hypothetical protein
METASLVFLIMVSTLGLVFALLCTYVDVNCCYIHVIRLISNGVHETKGTFFNVTYDISHNSVSIEVLSHCSLCIVTYCT